ncbi:MAG: tetratricopeptide repeat protein [Cycloclasticus sp.]|nr:tetratricopeptide repeat protein [Cycloclasticus sp.]MBQ0790176.1 tetratricopeptide repeat protein [Cycloclasticus sp.]
MDAYQTEEEQVESIKKWWSDNSRSIIFGLGLGLVAIFSWQSWKDWTHQQTVEASDIYQQLTQASKDQKTDTVLALAAELETTYSSTPYAALAGLQKAKTQSEQGNRDGAIITLEKVAADAANNSIQHIARIRALRLRLAAQQWQAVVDNIDSIINEQGGLNPGEFIGQYEALRGDAYRLLGDNEKARQSYNAALRTATLDSRILQLKLDDLGPPVASFASDTMPQSVEVKK